MHRPVGLLDHLELIGELLQRADHQVHVLEQQEGGAQGDRSVAHERRRQHERADEPDGDVDLQRPPHPQERRLAAHGAGDRLGAVLDEAPHRVVLGTVGAQVLDGGKPLLDAAVQPGVGAHLVGRLAHGPVAHAQDEERSTSADRRASRSRAASRDEQHGEHARDHDRRPGDLGNDLGQEVGDVGDVAVDALDQLARRVLAVELVVEAEHVASDVEAQPVGDPPRRHRRRAHDDDVEDLSDDGDDEEQDAEVNDLAGRRTIRWPRRRCAGRSSGPASAPAEAAAMSAPSTAHLRASGRISAVGHAGATSLSAPRHDSRRACGANAVGFSSTSRSSAIDATPTIPASFSNEATAISTSTSTYCNHLSALRLTPPPMINRSGENRNTTCSR